MPRCAGGAAPNPASLLLRAILLIVLVAAGTRARPIGGEGSPSAEAALRSGVDRFLARLAVGSIAPRDSSRADALSAPGHPGTDPTPADWRAWAEAAAGRVVARRAAHNASLMDRLPVVLISGLMGIQLEERITWKPDPVSWSCARSTLGRYVPAWIARLILARFMGALNTILCFVDDLKLVIRKTPTGFSYHDPPGVSLRPVEGLDGSMELIPGADTAPIFLNWVIALEALGWRRADITAAAYDWRRGPDDWGRPGGDFDRTQGAIEAVVSAAGGRPALLLALSLGGPYATLFLGRHVTPAWKRAHVARLVTASAAFGGSVHATAVLLTGALGDDNDTTPVVSGSIRGAVAATARTWGSIVFLSPQPAFARAAGRDGVPLVTAPWDNEGGASVTESMTMPLRPYYPADTAALLTAAGAPDTAGVWSHLASGAFDVLGHPPGVDLICLYGTGTPTPLQVHLPLGLRSFDQVITYGGLSPGGPGVDGDGTVARPGLELPCQQWGAEAIAYPGVGHAQIMGWAPALEEFLDAGFAERCAPGRTPIVAES